jgi:hypothetical protein
MTSDECCEYMMRVLEVCGHRTSAGAALLAILEVDPVRKAQYEREAAPFRERADKMRRLGLRVVASGKVKE